jgi:peptidoglycan-N-acetylglucosamine deacetylase
MLITIDVEDWFQVENFRQHIPHSSWQGRELRVEKNVHSLLDLFEESGKLESRKGNSSNPTNASNPTNSSNPSNRNLDKQPTDNVQQGKVRCTFFVLGWIAERLPGLVREIQSRGHEVASHGYSHNLCYDCGFDELRRDLTESRKLLEDILGCKVEGYRAPSFSINMEVLKIIEECGYLYDSSYNSFGLHGRYGRLDLTDYGTKGICRKISEGFYELPVSNLHAEFLNHVASAERSVIPWGGGGYFRLLPFRVFKKGVDSILRRDNAYLFYMHPWEIDPEQPRVDRAPRSFRFRHYCNLKGCRSKLQRLMDAYSGCNFMTCQEYIRKAYTELSAKAKKINQGVT